MHRLFAFILVTTMISSALAQHTNHGSHKQNPSPPASPYADFKNRSIKALSEQQIDDLRAGRGMSLALAAEMNSYPGPMHVLEHANSLQLTPAQRKAIERLMSDMRRDAIATGATVIAAEAQLDRLFASGVVNDNSLAAQLQHVSEAQGKLRLIHLGTHIATSTILSAAQISEYGKLRGYANP